MVKRAMGKRCSWISMLIAFGLEKSWLFESLGFSSSVCCLLSAVLSSGSQSLEHWFYKLEKLVFLMFANNWLFKFLWYRSMMSNPSNWIRIKQRCSHVQNHSTGTYHSSQNWFILTPESGPKLERNILQSSIKLTNLGSQSSSRRKRGNEIA